MPRLVVFGGRGFVGSAIVKEAVEQGLDVVAVSRSGTPPVRREPYADMVSWVGRKSGEQACVRSVPAATVVTAETDVTAQSPPPVCRSEEMHWNPLHMSNTCKVRLADAALPRCLAVCRASLPVTCRQCERCAGATAVISTVGAFGSQQEMFRVCMDLGLGLQCDV
jgi:NAD(P)-dependent dehydrogenase (short-subunit alcohol dehydrogenase family)